MAVISLPLTFNNSFWTQDYRTGLDIVFKKLEQVRYPACTGDRRLDQRSFTCVGHR